MRLYLPLAAVLSVVLLAQAELPISEHVEGSSNNKATEIYNPDGVETDLSAYKIEQYNNGASTSTVSFMLSGKLVPSVVHVMAHSTLVSVLGSCVNQTAAFPFNGDDTPTLTYSGVVVDRIGQVGYQPLSGFWGTASAGTKDYTLRRQGTVKMGDTDSTAALNPFLQWDALNIDDLSDLGLHNG